MVTVRRRTLYLPINERFVATLNEYLKEITNALSLISLSPRTHDITISDTGSADTEIEINHNLSKIPEGYIILHQDTAGSLYKISWTDTTATFKFSGANASVKIRLF